MAAPSASVNPPSASVTQLSAFAVTSARVMSSLAETRRAGCVMWSVGQTDGRTYVMYCGAGASFCCWLLERNDDALNRNHY
jgi:hypothetical protein